MAGIFLEGSFLDSSYLLLISVIHEIPGQKLKSPGFGPLQIPRIFTGDDGDSMDFLEDLFQPSPILFSSPSLTHLTDLIGI